MKLLVILFLIKLYAQKYLNLIDYIKGKYGQKIVNHVRSIERLRRKITKVKCDIKFLITCKKNKLTPVFAKPKLTIKIDNLTRQKITQTILEAELKNKHNKIKWLKKQEKETTTEVRNSIGFISMCFVNKRINDSIINKRKQWRKIHEGKLEKLFAQKGPSPHLGLRPIGNIIHNFSSYTLKAEEKYALSFGLDHHIPNKLNSNMIKTEFEAFFYNVKRHLSDLPIDEVDTLKSKLRRTCENYTSNHSSAKENKVIENLIKNKNIVVIKQDKGRGVVLLDKSKYIEKCLEHLNTDNFIKQSVDRTKGIEEKLQRNLLKVKSKLDETTYNKLYPSGSNPGRFYGTAKVHKLLPNEKNNVEKLTLRPIISNIGTAAYETSRYLCKLLAPLGQSTYTVNSTQEFISKIKNKKVPPGYQMFSFDVKSLFTNVPLAESIDIVLDKVFVDKVLKVPFTRPELKSLLMLCTEEVQFTFEGDIYIQADGVSMGSPLASLLANVFMCELENKIIPKLTEDMTPWYRYVDDTFSFINPTKLDLICKELNSFHQNIQFTYETETANQISFLDVLITRLQSGQLTTTVYRKSTNTNLYINWNSYSPNNWKIETLKNMTKRAAMICSEEILFLKELTYIGKVFIDINNYPPKLVQEIIANQKEEYKINNTTTITDNEINQPKKEVSVISLCLPYNGKKGENLINKLKKNLKHKLPDNVKTQITYKATKLQSKFRVKDEISFENKHNITYLATCQKCGQRYIGQTRCRCKKRVIEHNRADKESHLLKHANEKRHKRVWLSDFKILGSGYSSNFKRKISESLYIKRYNPEINVQKDAYKLKLFN